MNPDPRLGILHVHSDYSHDGQDTLEGLAELSRARGIGFVGLTEHAEDLDAEVYAEYLLHCAKVTAASGVMLIPGLEFRFPGFKGMHLLAFGVSRWIAPATPRDFLRLAAEAARFTMAAHPVLFRHELPEEVAAGIDAIEIWNASYNTRWLPDPKAISLLRRVRRRRPEVVGIAGLDQHDARNDRQARVRLFGEAPLAEPLLELKAGRFENVGRTMRLGASEPLGGAALGLLTLVRWGFDGVERTQEALFRLARRRRV